jgi:hypothetical protein
VQPPVIGLERVSLIWGHRGHGFDDSSEESWKSQR